jgi:probable H4MPT-linked C1 transfer pathway protein
MWRGSDRLAGRLEALLARFPKTTCVVATMTGELADCFATKAEGVAVITRALVAAAGSRPVRLWSIREGFVTPEHAIQHPFDVAASNWHALATWVGRQVPLGRSLLIDIGTTSSDLIPLADGQPRAKGATDLGRQLQGELVYTGARRTPLCAVPGPVHLRGVALHLAAELFATTLDIHLLRGDVAEDPNDRDTANGQPATRAAAIDRLARTLCCDRTELTPEELRSLADQLATAQVNQLMAAVDRQAAWWPQGWESVVLSGSGRFLGEELCRRHPLLRTARPLRLADWLSPEMAESAPAHALACLLLEDD